MSTKSPKQVEKIVNTALDKWRLRMGGLRAGVLPGTVREQEGWWYVPVGTDHEPARKFEYYDILSTIEEELQKNQRLNVLIVPSGTQAAKSSR